ncbi:unnamed protein product, partial [Pylaiella littoralis]
VHGATPWGTPSGSGQQSSNVVLPFRQKVDRGVTTARRSTGLLWWSRRGATKAFD